MTKLFGDFSKPSLIEPNVKYFMNGSLKHCKKIQNEYWCYAFNVGSLLFFVFVIFLLLFFRYKGRMTKEDKEQRETDKKHYILSTIKKYQTMKQHSKNDLITGLPEWNNEYDTK